MSIHPLAVVSPHAELGANVRIGPFAIVEAGVAIGDGCQLASRSVVKTGTILGQDNIVFEGAVIGGMPLYSLFEATGVLRGAIKFMRRTETAFTVIAKPR